MIHSSNCSKFRTGLDDPHEDSNQICLHCNAHLQHCKNKITGLGLAGLVILVSRHFVISLNIIPCYNYTDDEYDALRNEGIVVPPP